METEKRTYYFDFLRLLATFAVIVLHTTSQPFYDVAVTSAEWKVLNIADSCVRWSVPIFVMISGSLFLERKPDIKTMYTKYILRIATAFIFWSAVYAVFANLILGEENTVKDAVLYFIKGHFHLWFCFLIAGLYMLVPILSKIAENERLVDYFLLLSLFFVFLKPLIICVLSHFSEAVGSAVDTAFSRTNMYFTGGYVFFFLLGYKLNRVSIKLPLRICIYISGIAGIVYTIIKTDKASVSAGVPVIDAYENLTLNVMLTAVAVFVFAKQCLDIKFKSEKLNKWLKNLSRYSFGAYLVHMLVIYVFKRYSLCAISFNPWIAIPVLGMLTFVISMCFSAVLHRIPFVKKYFV